MTSQNKLSEFKLVPYNKPLQRKRIRRKRKRRRRRRR